MYKEFYEGGAPSFSAVCTMYNLPFKGDLNEVDYAIMGFPFDSASVNRSEARYAPSAIRNDVSFKGAVGYSEVLDVNADDYIKGTDLGEASIFFGYKQPSLEAIYNETKKVLESETMLIGLGGGSIVTLAELRAYKEKYGEISLIHFAAERNVTDYEIECDDSTIVLNAMQEGLINPATSIQLGIRGGYNSKAECEFGKDKGLKVVTASQMYCMSEEEIVKTIKEQVKDTPCFISIDMNFLDPVYAPGVVSPVVGGFSTHYLAKILRFIAMENNIKGLDLTGMTPAYDTGKVSAQAGSSLIKSFLFGIAKKVQNGGSVL